MTKHAYQFVLAKRRGNQEKPLPFQPEWQKRHPTIEECKAHLAEDPPDFDRMEEINRLIGLVPASAGLICIDIDTHPDAGLCAVCETLGEPYLTIRTRRGWHAYYRCENAPEFTKFTGDGFGGDIRYAIGYANLWMDFDVFLGFIESHPIEDARLVTPEDLAFLNNAHDAKKKGATQDEEWAQGNRANTLYRKLVAAMADGDAERVERVCKEAALAGLSQGEISSTRRSAAKSDIVMKNTARTGDTTGETGAPRPKIEQAEGHVSLQRCIADAVKSRIGNTYAYDEKRGEWLTVDYETGIWYRFKAAQELYQTIVDITVELTLKVSLSKREKMLTHGFMVSVRNSLSEDTELRHAGDWDYNADLLGTPKGVVDLRTNEYLSTKEAVGEHVSRETGIAPESGGCPAWDAFLTEATDGDTELSDMMMRYLAYSLTGDVRAEKAMVLFGPPRTGKTTFLRVAQQILGEYSRSVNIDNLAGTRASDHLQWLARLDGARNVVSSEPKKGAHWNSQMLNDFISGTQMSANFMRQGAFEFTPRAKLLMSCNVVPKTSGLENGIVQRLLLVKFDQEPVEKDTALKFKLEAEMPQILHKLLQICKGEYEKAPGERWEFETEHTNAQLREYVTQQDLVLAWLNDEDSGYRQNPEGKVPVNEPFDDFAEWWRGNVSSRNEANRRQFNRSMELLDCERKVIRTDGQNVKYWCGIEKYTEAPSDLGRDPYEAEPNPEFDS